ncbi:MAG: hypothetical protein ACR2JO_15205 [Mycobacteriales bacterium]
MTASSSEGDREPVLRLAIVLSTSEDACTVFAQDEQAMVSYAVPFPGPRTERVAPCNLVAIAAAPNGSDVVVWRWYDAVVLGEADGQIRLWEPTHGVVLAQARDLRRAYRPGSRAYLSAGLAGGNGWVAGATVARAEAAVVELDEVQLFFTHHDLWDRLT